MENTIDPYGLDKLNGSGDSVQWQDTIHWLRLVQSDYEGARKQIDKASHTLAERQTLIDQRLQYAVQLSCGYRPLCLVSYGDSTHVSQIGKAILGQTAQLQTLPRLMRLEVRCLGRFEVRCGWKQVERWQSVKAKSVFQYLMMRPREPVIKDVLMETLWPNCDPQAASNNLKAAMHGLRQTLSHLFDISESFPYVMFLQGSYLINPDLELWVDVEEFENQWMLGRHLEKEQRPHEAIKHFELAESIYRGNYLEDEPYDEWTLLRREALKDTYVTILGKLADYTMNTTDYESGIIYCQKILAKDPCREDAYRRLMHCYSRLGQRNRALRWYEICRQTIHTELDTKPDRETTALYQQLLRNESI